MFHEQTVLASPLCQNFHPRIWFKTGFIGFIKIFLNNCNNLKQYYANMKF